MLKSYRVGGVVVVAHVILVSALGPNPSFFLFWGTFIQLGGLLGQGPGLGLGPGLDNFWSPIWLKSLVVKLGPNSTHHTKFESNCS